MERTPVEIPSSWWERLRADRRLMAAAIAGVVLLVALGVAVARPLLAGGPDGGRDVAEIELPGIGIDDGSGEATSVAGADTTGSAGAGSGKGEASPDDEPDATVPGEGEGGGDAVQPDPVRLRAPYIAYRLAATIVVAREDGSEPVEVAESADGAFELSPDAGKLALVHEGELVLLSVEGGGRVVVGPADPRGLEWGGDSAQLYFCRPAESGEGHLEVWRVAADGTGSTRVVQGGPPSVDADGTFVAPPPVLFGGDPSRGTVWVMPAGRAPRSVSIRGQAVECDIESGLVAFSVHGMEFTDDSGVVRTIPPEIWVMRADGSAQRRLVGPPSSTRPFGYGSLILSPDGSHLLYAEVGDDGYSRAFVTPVGGGTSVPLTVRRDTYPIGWSADGSKVFFVEGNAFQGEPTSLMCAAPDGMGRRVLVEGGGL